MGLDVYLYHCPNREEAKAAEEEYEKLSERNWSMKDYEKLTEKQKKEITEKNKKLAEQLGCTGKYEAYKTVTKIEEDSKLYPSHMFKIGYFRSSYNGGGMETVLGNLGIEGLYEIFDAGDKYEFTPNWKEALKRVEKSLRMYQEHLNGPLGNIGVITVTANMFKESGFPQNEKEALDLYEKETTRVSPFKGGYSNNVGEFYPEGIEAIAFIPGEYNIMGKRSCVYVVYKKEKEVENDLKVGQVLDKLDKKEKDWYLQALEIVKETIEFVLNKPDPQCYYLHWSG